MPTLILSYGQAESVYAAMCALNNLGARGRAVIPAASHANEISVMWDDAGVLVVAGQQRQFHPTQDGFRAAYALDL